MTTIKLKNELVVETFNKFDKEINRIFSMSIEDFHKLEEDNRKFLNLVWIINLVFIQNICLENELNLVNFS